jgi:hypothetical protein
MSNITENVGTSHTLKPLKQSVDKKVKGVDHYRYFYVATTFSMGTTASGPTNHTESLVKEKTGGRRGSGSLQWRQRFQRNLRQLKTEQMPFKTVSQASDRDFLTSNLALATASTHVLTDSLSPSSHDSTILKASSTGGTSCPVAIASAHLLEIASLKKQTEASYQIKKHEFEELGCINFHFAAFHNALDDSRKTCRPVLLVQAEIPGDTDAGREIFSHPLIVEAADSLFTTVFNKDEDYSCSASRSASRKSRRTRVGFFDELGIEIGQSLSADMLTRAGIAEAMIATLEACDQPVPVPKYLRLLYDEERGRIKPGPLGLPVPCYHRAVFGMDDSTLGEVEFAGLEGVISTRAGFVTRQKVVEVIYDRGRLSFGSVIHYALKHRIGDIIYYQTNDERISALIEIKRVKESPEVTEFLGIIQLDKDSKRALRKSPLRFVPLTDLQATRANRLAHLNRFDEAMHLLSPRQEMIFMQAREKNSFKDVVDVPILPAWMSVCGQQIQTDDALRADPEMDSTDYGYSTEIGTVLNLYR